MLRTASPSSLYGLVDMGRYVLILPSMVGDQDPVSLTMMSIDPFLHLYCDHLRSSLTLVRSTAMAFVSLLQT